MLVKLSRQIREAHRVEAGLLADQGPSDLLVQTCGHPLDAREKRRVRVHGDVGDLAEREQREHLDARVLVLGEALGEGYSSVRTAYGPKSIAVVWRKPSAAGVSARTLRYMLAGFST